MDKIPEPQFPSVIDSSMRAIFSACPKKFFYEVALGIIPVDAKSVHLIAGAAYAKALETYRKIYYTTENYDLAIAEGLRDLITSYGDYVPPEGQTKTLERTIAAFVEYLVRYPPGTEHCQPTMGPNGPRVEFTFTFEIPGCLHPVTKDPLLFAGAWDQLVTYTGGLFLFDDKTTGAMGALWKYKWKLRSQFTGYVKGAQLNNLNVLGAVIRGMCILKESCKTEEAIVYRPQWMIDRWTERLVHDTERMISFWNANYWPNYGEENGSCVSYGVCPYHMLCESQNPEHFIPVHFKESRWCPLRRERQENHE